MNSFKNIKVSIIPIKIIIELFSIINIKINNMDDLLGLIIDRSTLLDNKLIDKITLYKQPLKNYIKSDYNNCLHINSNKKQKFPIINFYRQILKYYNLHLKPKVISLGYNNQNGKKIIKRQFVILQKS